MKTLEERIRRGREAIVRAKAQGKEIKTWEEHLANLERQLAEQSKLSGQRSTKSSPIPDPNSRVKVRMGVYGFCTCPLEKALCSGCWRIISACTCRELEVNPEEEITQQYAQLLKKINTPLRH